MFLTKNPFSDHGPNKKVLSEAFKYHIPEDIPANERTAFHGAAAAAAKAGKKSFNFGGKTHPVTMKKDTAKSIPTEAVKYPHMMYDPKTGKEVTAKTPMDHAKFSKMGYTHEKPKMNEISKRLAGKYISKASRDAYFKGRDQGTVDAISAVGGSHPHQDYKKSPERKAAMRMRGIDRATVRLARNEGKEMSIREKLMSLYEGDRAAHYKSAAEPEPMHMKSMSSKGAMDMLNTPKSTEADGMKAAKDTADNINKSAPGKKLRKADKNTGDLAIKPSATPVKDPAAKMQTAESYGVSGNKVADSLLDAIEQVTKEGSIKGSGTDRKAVLKKAFRAGEDDTRRFYSGKKPTIKPPKGMRDLKKFDAKHKDKGIQKAFAGGRAAGDGDETIKGKARMKPQSNLPLNKYQRQGIKIDRKDKADTAAYVARTKGK